HPTQRVADELYRRDEEAHDQCAWLAGGPTYRVALENLHFLRRRPVLALRDRRAAQGVELDLFGTDLDIGARQVAQLLDLRIREGSLGRPAPPQEIHLSDSAPGEGLQRVVCDVGRRQLLAGPAKDPCR